MKHTRHYHLWSRSASGAEFANAVFESKYDAAQKFVATVNPIFKGIRDGEMITIEQAVNSFDNGRGMFDGIPGLVFVLSDCSGKCKSPVWN